MTRFCACLFLFALAGCQSTYAPAPDGRVSVIDLVLFPGAYAGQSVLLQGHLRYRDGAATFYFQAEHADRLQTRFAFPAQLQGERAAERAEACSGAEALARGVVEQTDSGWALAGVEDFVC